MPITLISWAHHSIKQKLQKLPTWNKASQRKSLKKTNGHCAIEAKNDEAEEAAALAASADSEVKLVSMESNHLGGLHGSSHGVRTPNEGRNFENLG